MYHFFFDTPCINLARERGRNPQITLTQVFCVAIVLSTAPTADTKLLIIHLTTENEKQGDILCWGRYFSNGCVTLLMRPSGADNRLKISQHFSNYSKFHYFFSNFFKFHSFFQIFQNCWCSLFYLESAWEIQCKERVQSVHKILQKYQNCWMTIFGLVMRNAFR